MPSSEIEARGFQHQALEADDPTRIGFKHLGRSVSTLSFSMSLASRLTGSSAARCSEGDNLRLYAAQTISRDFLSVSSILHAVNKAAAAASCVLVRLVSFRTTERTYREVVLIVWMH